MGTATLQISRVSYGAPGLIELPPTRLDQHNGGVMPGLRRNLGSNVKSYEFRGRLEIPDAPFVLPEQDFTATFTADENIKFKSRAASPYPKISIELAIDQTTGNVMVEQFQIRPVGESADAEIYYTRVQYVLGKSCQCVFQFADGQDILPFRFEPPTAADEQKLLHRAKIFRKLKYIEQVFNTKFLLPKEISGDEVAIIEFVFRAITEGEFTTRQQQIVLPFDPSKVDLTKPPFDVPGPLIYRAEEDWIELFGRRLLIGNPVVLLSRAEIASPQAVRQIRQGKPEPVLVRFDILDHQIHYRFENRATKSAKRLQQQKLKFFRQELSKSEPIELANLLDEPLITDVSAAEASLIAMGWTQYNNLPDRYCPQEPERDSSANTWRVPIKFGYPTGQNGEAGELLIDAKTGKVVSHTPIEEIRSRGKGLAKTFLHAS